MSVLNVSAALLLPDTSSCPDTFPRVYSNLRKMYPTPNERLPLVDTDEFKQQLTAHPNFGKPVNGFDLFHGTKKDAVPSIMQNGFDDHFFNPDGYFGAGAYFADDPGLSMSFIDASPSHMFVCNVILGNTDETHYKTPRNSTLGRDFRPPHGVDSVKGRITYVSTFPHCFFVTIRTSPLPHCFFVTIRTGTAPRCGRRSTSCTALASARPPICCASIIRTDFSYRSGQRPVPDSVAFIPPPLQAESIVKSM